MAQTNFSGPIRVSSDITVDGILHVGASASSTIGTVPALQRVSVSGNGKFPLTLPRCRIARQWMSVETVAVTGNIQVGTSADEDFYGQIAHALSAQGTIDVVPSGVNTMSAADGTVLVVHSTAAACAALPLVASYYIQYMKF